MINKIDMAKLTNEKIKEYSLLECMYHDAYFPAALVDKCRDILLELCYKIEAEKPDKEGLYKLTHYATDKLNGLQDEFESSGSEIETVARECLAADFLFIANAYGFEADIEKLVENREW
ncbi:MAG: DUF5713 family protein [Bacteroidia bacterium]